MDEIGITQHLEIGKTLGTLGVVGALHGSRSFVLVLEFLQLLIGDALTAQKVEFCPYG